jgi:hypothetical protein
VSVTWQTAPAVTRQMTLDEVVAALARAEWIEAVAVIGSGNGGLRPESDLDLLVVLADDAPRLGVGLTHVGGRLTDLVFARSTEIAALGEALRDGSRLQAEQSRLAASLAEGRVRHDRSGATTHVAGLARERPRLPAPSTPADQYALWFSVNFNVLHTERMARSADPLYGDAIDLRFLYQLVDLLYGYFRLRGLEAHGEKEALRRLAIWDPAWLKLFQSCLHEPDRARRVALYRQLAQAALAPFGPLWSQESTALTLENATPETLADALGLWNGLFAG